MPNNTNNNTWWIYVVVIVGVIAIYFISGAIVHFLMKGAKKKAYAELEKIIPYEKTRFEEIEASIKHMQDDGRFLPKNMIDCLNTVNDSFSKVPVDVASIKNQNDFLIMYIRKYLADKHIVEKYKDIDEKLEKHLYLDPSSKTSPYHTYNKKAAHYNAYLGMGIFNIFRGSNTSAPIL